MSIPVMPFTSRPGAGETGRHVTPWRGPFLVALLLVATASHLAGAAKPVPIVTPVAGSIPHAAADIDCVLGIAAAAQFEVNYLLPPHDRYYTLLRRSACTSCGGTVVVREAHVSLSFPVACTVPVEISIVGSVGDTSCFAPDTLRVLVPPVAHELVAENAGVHEYLLSFDPAHALGEDAFLCIDFTSDAGGCATLTTRPRLLTTAGCAPCKSYNTSVADDVDLCDVLFPGNPVMFVGAGGCTVPVASRSWGSLKLRYR